MFPFHVPNGYLNPQFTYNMNYDIFRLPQLQGNPFIYPYNYQNFNLLHETPNSNYITNNQLQYFLERNPNCSPGEKTLIQKKKRITKKLIFTQVKKKLRSINLQFKSKRKTFKYFDPSRAPPITSLRNNQQLILDVKRQEQKTGGLSLNKQQAFTKLNEGLRKLDILLKQPNERNYPFLICKKRTYHRNLKRRYSVAYFQQRASYIVNKEPIPASLHPKNKVRKSRCLKKSMSGISQSLEESQNSQQLGFSEQNDKNQQENPDFDASQMKVANKIPTNENQIISEIPLNKYSNQIC